MTIWLDRTTSLASSGHNGIANVEWSLGVALAAELPGLRCFALRSGCRLTELGQPTEESSVAHWDEVARRQRRRDAKVFRRRSAQSVVITLMRRSANRVRRLAVLTSRAWTPAADIRANDVVVSVGADWSGAVMTALRDTKIRTGCKVVTMVYDLIPVTHPHLAFHHDPDLFVRYYQRVLDTSDLVLCISKQTRRDLEVFARSHHIQAPRVEVLQLGETAPEVGSAEERSDFFLVIGTIERRKNLELLYDAVRVLDDGSSDLPTIVVAGGRGWGVDDLLAEVTARSTRASKAFVLLGPVSNATLDLLYRRARALLFPSHYEGWGLPVREAAVRGCPVAAGDTEAVREAAAGYGGATFLPVNDPFPWAEYLRSPAVGAHAIRHRSWTEVAREMAGMCDPAAVAL